MTVGDNTLKRNYFGTLMLLFLPLSLLLPLTLRTLVALSTAPKVFSRGEAFEILSWLLDSNLIAVWCTVVLVTALFKRDWFLRDQDPKVTFNRYLSLGIGGLINYAIQFHAHSLSGQSVVSSVFWCFAVYWGPYQSLRAEVHTLEGRRYQPFMIPLRHAVKMNFLGSLLTVTGLVAPSFYALYLLVDGPGMHWRDLDWAGAVALLGALGAAWMASKEFADLGVNAYEWDRPFVKGLYVVAAPLLFGWFCYLRGSALWWQNILLTEENWKGMGWLSPLGVVDSYAVFCGAYLVAGVVGYVAYVLPTDNVLAKLFRVYGADPEAEEEPSASEKYGCRV